MKFKFIFLQIFGQIGTKTEFDTSALPQTAIMFVTATLKQRIAIHLTERPCHPFSFWLSGVVDTPFAEQCFSHAHAEPP
jgi:hypothetical protein